MSSTVISHKWTGRVKQRQRKRKNCPTCRADIRTKGQRTVSWNKTGTSQFRTSLICFISPVPTRPGNRGAHKQWLRSVASDCEQCDCSLFAVYRLQYSKVCSRWNHIVTLGQSHWVQPLPSERAQRSQRSQNRIVSLKKKKKVKMV